jgi:hypothetical protein
MISKMQLLKKNPSAPSEIAEIKRGRTVKERDVESIFSLNLSYKEV